MLTTRPGALEIFRKIKRFHYEMPKYAEKDEGHRGEYKRQENKLHMVDEAGQKDTQMVCNKLKQFL